MATCEVQNRSLSGQPAESKKLAKTIAARTFLDALVRDGTIKVESAGIQPLPSVKFNPTSPIFEFFKKIVYDAFEEVQKIDFLN